MNPHDASAEELIRAGWGSHARHRIPADWQTVKGPDTPWGFHPDDPTPRKTWKTRKPTTTPVKRRETWREARAKWLLDRGMNDQFAREFGACTK